MTLHAWFAMFLSRGIYVGSSYLRIRSCMTCKCVNRTRAGPTRGVARGDTDLSIECDWPPRKESEGEG